MSKIASGQIVVTRFKQSVCKRDSACVAIVDDDASVRRTLVHILNSAGLNCRPYQSAELLLDETGDFDFGCFVVDLNLPGVGGLELLRDLRGQSLDVPIVVISGSAKVSDAIASFRTGISAFLEKPFDCSELLDIVQTQMMRFVEKRAKRLKLESTLRRLSAREREVMDAFLAGQKTIQVGRRLNISPSTVEKHRLRIFEKTGVGSIVDLMLLVGVGN